MVDETIFHVRDVALHVEAEVQVMDKMTLDECRELGFQRAQAAMSSLKVWNKRYAKESLSLDSTFNNFAVDDESDLAEAIEASADIFVEKMIQAGLVVLPPKL